MPGNNITQEIPEKTRALHANTATWMRAWGGGADGEGDVEMDVGAVFIMIL